MRCMVTIGSLDKDGTVYGKGDIVEFDNPPLPFAVPIGELETQKEAKPKAVRKRGAKR